MSASGIFRAAFLGAALSVAATTALAQEYPNKPIKIIIPWGSGQSPDVIMRAVGQGMSKHLGQPVVVENKPGATGAIGADFVAASAPDGYTLLDLATAYLIGRGLRGQSFDANKDLAPIAMVTNSLTFLSVNSKAMKGVRTLDDFVAFAKANPQQVFHYGSSGIGSSTHLAMALIAKKFGLNANHIPYKSGAPMITDYLSGQLIAMVTDYTPLAAYVKSGQVTPIMILQAQRTDQMPDVPTARELGHPDVEVVISHGLSAPAGTPAPILEKLAAAVKVALSDPEVMTPLRVTGNRIVYTSLGQYATALNESYAKWMKFVQDNGIKAE